MRIDGPAGRGRVGHAGFAFLSILLVLALGSAGPVSAVSVSISAFDLRGEPGEEVAASFTVFNDDAEPVEAQITPVDWDLDVDGVTRFHPPSTLVRSCAAWLAAEPTVFSLVPGAEAEVHLRLRIPEDARGTFWTGLLVRVGSPEGGESGADLRSVRQFLVRITQTVAPITLDGRAGSVRVLGLAPLGVETRFHNYGDAILRAVVGLVVVQDGLGVTLGEIRIPPFGVLPGYAVDRIVVAGFAIQRPGSYLIRAVYDFGAEHLVAGQVVLRVAELRLVPVEESGTAVPTDLDGDGRYEDVDGDGTLGLSDVKLLAASLESASIRDNARAFDFNNDGEVTVGDVAWLEDLVLRRAG